jgi:eukaryotic-like serine/threonine-protein kinase
MGTCICPVDGAELILKIADPLIGTTLPRHYRFLSMIGKGAMSIVYKGLHEPMKKEVAIKLLKSHLVGDAQTYKRFQQESKTAGALYHPNIVGVLDFGVTDQAVPYLIMELLEGESLSELIKEGPLSVERGIRIFHQVADALSYTHNRSVIHRDIKPSNIIIMAGPDGTDIAKVVDFGIAKIMHHEGGGLNLTKTGEVFGTPLYVSPEQAQGKLLDQRTDIYSLGCVMYEAFSGVPIFKADTAYNIIKKQVLEEPVPVDTVNPNVVISPALAAIIHRALVKDPARRYQTMAELKQALRSIPLESVSDTIDLQRGNRSIPPIPSYKGPQPAQGPKLPRIAGPLFLSLLPGVLLVVGLAIWSNSAIKRTSLDGFSGTTGATTIATSSSGAQPVPAPGRALSKPAALREQARLYFKAEEFERAEKACLEGLDLIKDGSNRSLQAELLSQLASVEYELGKEDFSEVHAQEALALFETLPDSARGSLATVLQGLGEVEERKANYNQAQKYFLKALKLETDLYGESHPRVADTLQELGKSYQHQKKDGKALECYEKALAITQKFNPDSAEAADTLQLLGTLYFQLDNHKLAETKLKRALEIDLKSVGEFSKRTGGVVFCLALLYDSDDRLELAEENYKRALSISEKVFSSDSPIVRKRLTALAGFLRKVHKDNEAVIYEKRLNSLN